MTVKEVVSVHRINSTVIKNKKLGCHYFNE